MFNKKCSKGFIVFFIIFFFGLFSVFAEQTEKAKKSDSEKKKETENFEVVVTAPRMEIPLKENPAATTVVSQSVLENLPRSIALDEVMKLVPGVRVDNQADGERVHFYIRGQGILTERGTRGIKVLVDGIPLNDPTGFVSDLYDIDWATVKKIEVLRGPAAALYGSGSSGGVINIITRDGSDLPVSVRGFFVGGSYGFYKALTEANGTFGGVNYRITGSMTSGDGYRDHSAYSGKNFYGKFNIGESGKNRATIILSATDFFNENPEGLNLAWFSPDPDNLRKLANPDAYTFNEYQRTQRLTGGFHAELALFSGLKLDATAYFRHTKYKEAVPSSVIHRTYKTPGMTLQLSSSFDFAGVKNSLSSGIDFAYQNLDEFKHPNLGAAVEGNELQSNQKIEQSGLGLFFIDRVELSKELGFSFTMRYDRIKNSLTDNLKIDGIDLSDSVEFEKLTGRVGVYWNPFEKTGFYANWGSGFLPPGTEELINNPYNYGGYNTLLKSATSSGIEFGMRGVSEDFNLNYDFAVFYLKTDNDFGRYRIKTRPLETFYGNVGSTNRYGLETLLGWFPVEGVALRLSYTYSHFKYDEVKTMDSGMTYKDTFLPNSPEHQLYFDSEFNLISDLTFGASVEHVSSWFIDATNRVFPDGYGKTSPYTLMNVRLIYKFDVDDTPFEFFIFGRNIFNAKYYGFTEPDPDGNSYQPAPTSEWSLGFRFVK